MSTPEQRSAHYDVVVVGAGPAGISAAINVANRKRSVLLLDSQAPFAKTRRAPTIPNYPGFTYASGEDLAAAFVEHMERFEIPFSKEKVSKIMPDEGELLVFTDKEMYHARAVILATGVYREADLEGEDALIGRGVSYCANCDGRLFAGKDVAFISYIPEGEEEAAVLYEDLGVTLTYIPLYAGEPTLPQGVTVLPRERPDRLHREDGKVVVELKAGPLKVDGVFVHKTSVAPGDLVDGIQVDDRHILVGRDMSAGPPGVFAAGDCTGEPYQIAKAVGEGQVAALHALSYLRTSTRTDPSETRAETSEPPAGPSGPPADSSGPPAEPPALAKEDKGNLSRILRERMSGPVRIIHFGQIAAVDGDPIPACGGCRDARRLVEEFASLHDRLQLEVHDLLHDHAMAESLGVDRIPATLLSLPGEERPRVRFFGSPTGYEFGVFLDDVLALSAGGTRLSQTTQEVLRGLDHPVHIEVLTTPTCPRCPDVVRLAHSFAMADANVTADMVAVSEFPEVARLHDVMSVPQVVIDGVILQAGRVDEAGLLDAVVRSKSPKADASGSVGAE